MKTYAPLVAGVTIAAMLAGCSGGGGVRFSDLFDESAAAEGTGIQGFGLVRAVVILATHDATARQRQVAEQNGRRAVARLKERLAAEEKEAVPSKPSPKVAEAKPTPTVDRARSEEPAPTTKPEPRKKLPRIIAVATEKNEETDKKAAKAVMLFDTYSQEIVGNKVYDIETEPQKGDTVRFETYSTTYVGASI